MPKFVYKLLDNKSGIIITRNPKSINEKIKIRFEGAPDMAYAVFEFSHGHETYKELYDGECTISFPHNSGTIKVAVVLEGSTERWICEQLKYDVAPCGDILVSPNDMNLPKVVTDLKIENEKQRNEIKRLNKRLDDLETRLKNIMEGYDLM